MKNFKKVFLGGIYGVFLLFPHLNLMAVDRFNGFDLSSRNVPLKEIQTGGPGKDGIPALIHPKFIPAGEASFLKANDRVLGISIGGKAKAYPIPILNWHEVVNDSLSDQPLLISYCPLCGTGMVFDPRIKGKPLTFGVSGLLYLSDVLMYDHQTESLWSQIKQEAISGALMGSRLKLIPVLHTTWEAWKKDHPHTLVLSQETGFFRDYDRDPYRSYAETSRLMFSVGNINPRLKPKDWVLGLHWNGRTKAYPFLELEKGSESFQDDFGTQTVLIEFEKDTKTARVKDIKGRDLPSVVAYWFAWSAFYPKTFY